MPYSSWFYSRWQGEVPVARLFWQDILTNATVINLIATVLAMAVLVQGAHPALAVALHFVPMPYNIFLCAALWRHPERSAFTSGVALAWLVFMTVI